MEQDLNDIITQYIELRDKIQEIKDECDTRIAPLRAVMDKIESDMSGLLERSNLTSMSTPAGSVVKMKWTKTALNDWEAFTNYVKEHDRFDLIEHRVAKNNALEVISEEGGLPGVSVETGFNIQIRRK